MDRTRSSAPRAVLFDLDGTLVDSLTDIASALNEALAALGLEAVAAPRVRGWIGDGLPVLCLRAATHAHAPRRAAALTAAAARAYETHCTRTTALYPKMLEILDLLRDAGVPMAVLSNKPHEFVDRIIRKLGLENHFVTWRGYQAESDKKPSPRIAIEIASSLELPPADVVVIGDSLVDFETARNAGMRFIAVTWGFGTTEKIIEKNPDWIVETPSDLRKIFFD